MHRKVPAGTRDHPTSSPRRVLPSAANPTAKRMTPSGIMRANPEIEQMRITAGRAGPDHEGRYGQCVGRLVHQSRHEDAEPSGASQLDLIISRNRTCQGNASNQGMHSQPERGRSPRQGPAM